MTDEELTKKGSPLPWRTEKDRSGTIYDATGIFVLSVWWQEAKFIVERVNAHEGLKAENAALKQELQSLADISEAAWRFPGEDALRKLHRAVQAARKLLEGN